MDVSSFFTLKNDSDTSVQAQAQAQDHVLPFAIRVLVISWNAQSVRFSARSGQIREPCMTWTGFDAGAADPDFLQSLATYTASHNATAARFDVIVVGFQESAWPGCQLVHEALPAALSPGYARAHETHMYGLGITTWKRLLRNWRLQLRGLSTSVYMRTNSPLSHSLNITSARACVPGISQLCTWAKGATYTSINIGPHTRVCFVNVHLPFNSASLYEPLVDRFSTSVAWQTHCLRMLLDKVPSDVTHVVVLGDLNFRCTVPPHTMIGSVCDLMTHDELRTLLQYGKLLPTVLHEGPADSGPHFMPTAKMHHCPHAREQLTDSRLASHNDTHSGTDDINVDAMARAYKLGQHTQRIPSWCDRILYARVHAEQAEEQVPRFVCTHYDRWDEGNMSLSDHTAVVAEFMLR